MSQLTNIYFKNRSYFQAFFKEYQFDESVTQFIAETALLYRVLLQGYKLVSPCTSHTGRRYLQGDLDACMKIRLNESQLGQQK